MWGIWLSRAARDPYVSGDRGSPSSWSVGIPGDQAEARIRYLRSDDRILRAEIERTDGVPWSVQLSRRGYSLIKDRRYRVAFEARADQRRSLGVLCLETKPPFAQLGLYQDLEVYENWRRSEFEFTASATDPDAALCFNLGMDTAAVELKEIAFIPLATP